MNNNWSYQKFSMGRLIYPWLRPERIVLILALVNFMRDNFKAQYDENADMVLFAHLIVVVICIFADVIKKKIDTSNIEVGSVRITDEDKTKSVHSHREETA